MAIENRPAVSQPSKNKLNAAPFVFDRIKHAAPRAWAPSKPTEKTAHQITIALGSVYARIAGSAVTFPMDVQIVFSDKTSTPDVVLRQPWQSAPGGRGGEPLFVADDDATAKLLADSLGNITDDFLKAYSKLPADSRLDFDTLDYATAQSLIRSKAGAVRRALPTKAA